MERIKFTVASELLGELGEALVGQPHIALGELIKNSYDADAKKVTIRVAPGLIEVSDNGHGMSRREFNDFWMRIGSQHKRLSTTSRTLERPITGSKGIGRLSAQFLGSSLELVTATDEGERQLFARVDWSEAVKAGELTEAVAEWEHQPKALDAFPDGSEHGTTLRIGDLKQEWDAEAVRELAKEIWWLQPPFERDDFLVEFVAEEEGLVEEFDQQMRAITEIWQAQIIGGRDADDPGSVFVAIQWAGERQPEVRRFEFPDLAPLPEAVFHIRVYLLRYRQPRGIKVAEAREYLNRYGGVHIYDAGFHLPYYGPKSDWLEIQFDHARRVDRSALLPTELQEAGGISYLPPNSRILGSVRVDTGAERANSEAAGRGDYLQIQISRDRLVENRAYKALRDMVRVSLDWFAVLAAGRAHEAAAKTKPIEPSSKKLRSVAAVLETYKGSIEPEAYEDLKGQVSETLRAQTASEAAQRSQLALFGSLATAGMAALAYEHEVQRQLRIADGMSKRLSALARKTPDLGDELSSLGSELHDWVERAKANRALFLPLLEGEALEERSRFRAKTLVEEVVAQTELFLRRVSVEVSGLPSALLLPHGTHAEWVAVFQNVLFNAANAMVDAERKILRITGKGGRRPEIRIEDTGVGVDLSDSERLFEPFVREVKISSERRALGIGGSGLGLTIVRMITESLGCAAEFASPSEGFSTAFVLSWTE